MMIFKFFATTLLIFSSLIAFTEKQDPLEESKKRGKRVYETNCQSCHMANGQGISAVFPPLAKSDYLMEDKTRSIKQVIKGAIGKMTVNGIEYDGSMPAQAINDQQVADVLNYVRNTWGNTGEIVTEEEVKAIRAEK